MRLVIRCVLFLLLLVPPLFAQDSYREFERGLNLSDSQRTQVEGIRRKYSDEWRNLNNESMEKRLQLNDMNRGQGYRKDRAERVQRELGEIEAQRRQLYNQYRGEVGRVMNEQQRERYEQFITHERRNSPMPARPGTRPGMQKQHGR